jgi:hypothetical protein
VSRTWLAGSSGRGGSDWELYEGVWLTIFLLFGGCVPVCWSKIPKKPVDATLLGSWVTGRIPGSSSGDNVDDISTAGGLATFGGEESISGVVGTGMSIFPLDG